MYQLRLSLASNLVKNQHLLEMTGACDLFIALLLNDSPVPKDMRKSVSQCALYS